MPLPNIKNGMGDMPSYEVPQEGSKINKGNPSPFFKDMESTPVPSESKWVHSLIYDFYLKLRKMVFHTALPLWQFPPFVHVPIDIKFTSAAIAPAGTATLATIVVPRHQVAVIRLYGQDVEAVVPPTLSSSWNNIAWTFRVGQFPLQYFDGFVGQRGSLNNMRPTTIVIEGPDEFVVSVVNNSAALSYFATISLVGHQYSVLDAPMSREDLQNL